MAQLLMVIKERFAGSNDLKSNHYVICSSCLAVLVHVTKKDYKENKRHIKKGNKPLQSIKCDSCFEKSLDNRIKEND
jgi:hypothetical protein